MRVAVDARKLHDYGIGTYIRGLVLAMSQLKPQYRFELLGPAESPFAELRRENISWRRCPGTGYSPADIMALSHVARQTAADIFHAPHYVTPLGLDLPLVVTIHDCIHLRYAEHLPRVGGILPRAVSRWYAAVLLRRAVHEADAVITVSDSTRHDVLGLLAGSVSRTHTVLNGVDRFWSEPCDMPSPARRSVLWVGNPKPHKLLPRLIEAFRIVASECDDVDLVLVGGVAPGDGVPADLHGRVRAHPWLPAEELRDCYRAAAVFCLPSGHEGFGLPALEAMACGTPVVAASRGSLPELVGDAGLLADPDDPADLANSILRLLGDPDLGARCAERGRQRATQLTWHRAAETTLAIYEGTAR